MGCFPSCDEGSQGYDNNNGDSMKLLFGFVACTAFIFAAVNWALRPLFPVAAQYVPMLNVWHCAGLSACLMIVWLFVGNGK